MAPAPGGWILIGAVLLIFLGNSGFIYEGL